MKRRQRPENSPAKRPSQPPDTSHAAGISHVTSCVSPYFGEVKDNDLKISLPYAATCDIVQGRNIEPSFIEAFTQRYEALLNDAMNVLVTSYDAADDISTIQIGRMIR